MAETLATPGRRVKVYVLNGAGKWDDRGTGHVRVETDPDTKALVLKVTSDETGRISLTSTIRATHEAFYQMQEDNIISWNEEIPPGVPTEVALSFQETEGCRELWEKICHVDAAFKRTAAQRAAAASSRNQPAMNAQSGGGQGAPADGSAIDPLAPHTNVPSTTAENLHHHTNPADGVPLVDPTVPDTAHSRFFDDNLEGSAWGNADAIDDVVFPDTANVLILGTSPTSFVPTSNADATAPTAFVMPEPDRAGVEALARIMSDQAALSMRTVREEIIAEVLTSDYITKLCQVFRRAEQDGDLDCLAMLYHVIRCLFVIGNNGVLEILVSEKHLMDVVGCLEYDQEHMAELERQKAESKRKEDKKKPNSATSPEAQSTSPKTDVSSGQHSRAERQAVSEEKKPSTQAEEKFVTSGNPGVTAASEQQGAMDVETSKTTSESKECHDPSAPEKNTQNGDEIEEKIAAAETPTLSGSPSKGTSCQVNQSLAEKNNSEETSSSGNIPDGDAPRFALRTHRDYLERKVSYRSVVPINDQNVVAKIHQNYRVAYIRDVILSRVFDDAMSNMLSGVILCNNVDIIMYFISGSTALHELFTRLKATVQNRRRMQEVTATSGRWAYKLSEHRETELSMRSHEKEALASHDVISTHDPAKTLTDDRSDELKDVSSNPGHKQETSSSSGLDTSPTSNPISLTTSDSCPATDPNFVTSADQSSRDVRGEEKKELLDSATGDPKSSEQSEEFHEDLRNMLGLLRELCQIVKGQQPAVQARFHQMLLELGALEISVGLLLDRDPVLRSLCCDILSTAIYHDQGDVRAHIMKNATQQHTSVPKQQIGSRKAAHGAKPIEESAIVTQAGASGVTAEVAIGEEHLPALEKNFVGSSNAPDEDMSTSDDPGKSQIHRHLPTNSVEATTDTDSRETQAGFAPERKEASAPTTPGKSQDTDSNGSEGVDTPSVAKSAPKLLQSSALLERTSTGTHPMVTACLGEPEKCVRGDGQDDAFRSNLSTRGEQQSRVETDFPLLSAMIDVICQDKESGVALTVLELLRTLLDPMNMKPSLEKSMFLNVFYDKFIYRLMAPIEVAAHPERRHGTNEKVSDENVSHICDLMSYCVSHHAFRCKYVVLGSNVGRKIVELVRDKRAHVRLSGVRFVRICVGMRDDVYDRYIVQERIMDPVMELYAKNQYKDNLTSSSVLDLVSFLASTKRELLLRHIFTEYSTLLQPTTKSCSVFKEAKRVLDEIERDKTLHIDGRNQGKSADQGNDLQVRAGETGATEQRGFLGKNDADDMPHKRTGVFLSHLDGEVSNQAVIHSTFRDGAMAGNIRFGTSFHGHDMRMFNEDDAFFTRLTGTSDVVHKLSGSDQESAELQLKPGVVGPGLGYGGRSPDQGSIRQLETRGLSTSRGILTKNPPFKTGLRSVSQSGPPKRGQGGVKSILSTGLRSQAAPAGDGVKLTSPNTSDAKWRSPEKGYVTLTKGKRDGLQSNDKDVIMTDETPRTNQFDATATEFHDESNQVWNGKAVRMSLSKSQAKNGEVTQLSEREDDVLLSESSEDRHSPRKRERIESENSIEICTKSLLGRRSIGEDSPTKRRRVVEEAGAGDKDEKTEAKTGAEERAVKSEGDSGNMESESKDVDGTRNIEGPQTVDGPQLNRSSDGQGDREKR